MCTLTTVYTHTRALLHGQIYKYGYNTPYLYENNVRNFLSHSLCVKSTILHIIPHIEYTEIFVSLFHSQYIHPLLYSFSWSVPYSRSSQRRKKTTHKIFSSLFHWFMRNFRLIFGFLFWKKLYSQFNSISNNCHWLKHFPQSVCWREFNQNTVNFNNFFARKVRRTTAIYMLLT